jgi:hypothetical protein
MKPGEGASSRNGGITSGSIRPDNATIARRFGEEKAMAIEAEGKIAREFLYDSSRPKSSTAISGWSAGSPAPSAMTSTRRWPAAPRRWQDGWGSRPTRFRMPSSAAISAPISTAAAAVRMDIGGLHPAKFHAELLRVALASGLTVHSETPVTAIERDGDPGSALRRRPAP